MLIQPIAIRLLASDATLDFFVGHDATFYRIYKQHASRSQTVFVQNALRLDIQHAYFGSKHDQIICRHIITRRTQTIPI
ncbi:hypothetical protein D3C85_1087070 [compost metagenome]